MAILGIGLHNVVKSDICAQQWRHPSCFLKDSHCNTTSHRGLYRTHLESELLIFFTLDFPPPDSHKGFGFLHLSLTCLKKIGVTHV